MSIVAIILSLSSASTPSADSLTEAQHASALEYLQLQLSVRDRTEIVRVLCHRNPAHLTAMIQDGVAAYTPMIRQVHEAVNLSDTVWDFERFVTDMLKMSKPGGPKGGEQTPPSVEDYVDLLHRHQASSHKFLHQVAKNGREVTGWWRDWAGKVVSQFARHSDPSDANRDEEKGVGNGRMQEAVENNFAALSSEDQQAVKAELDAQAEYLTDLHAASAARITAVIERSQSTPFGPGAYLARWQNLLDATLITPATVHGPVRKGGNKQVKEEGRKDIEGNETGLVSEEEVQEKVGNKTPDAPDVRRTVELLAPGFRGLIAGG